MGGTTQSKLAFINPALKKKGAEAANEANKSAVVEDVKTGDVVKTQVCVCKFLLTFDYNKIFQSLF